MLASHIQAFQPCSISLRRALAFSAMGSSQITRSSSYQGRREKAFCPMTRDIIGMESRRHGHANIIERAQNSPHTHGKDFESAITSGGPNAEAMDTPESIVSSRTSEKGLYLHSVRRNPLNTMRPTKRPAPLRTAGTAADEVFMREALRLAREAYAAGEVPIGAVVVDECGAIIGTGRNRVEASSDASAHAEMEALRGTGVPAAVARGWRRANCTLYTTIEPCAMCFAAASLFRVSRVVFAAPDLRLGACGTWIDLTDVPHPFHMMKEVTGGVLKGEASFLMKSFFKERRKQ